MKISFVVPLFAAIFFSGISVQAAESDSKSMRQIYSLNSNWQFLKNDCSKVEDILGVTAQWTIVQLPHTWNLWDAVDAEPGYYRGAGWYKRDFVVPPTARNARCILYFEGINITSDVYINGARAGGHIGGYVGFEVDITQLIRPGEKNMVCVRASNAYNPDIIPSQKSDFHIYGGITRNVWLKIVPEISISAVQIRTPKVSASAAEVEAEVLINNNAENGYTFDIDATIIDRNGKECARQKLKQKISKGTSSVKFQMPAVKKPFLWSPDDPALYEYRVRLSQSGTTIDESSDRFGCRWFEFRDHGPFFLNGKRLLLRGTHRHEDYAGFANAMPDSLQRKDMKMIKEMGANFVRLAHYPQAPEVYRACDELGILLWDELPWCRGGMGGEEWKANTRRLLTEQIVQNFNHPSIIIHSLGNEFSWLPDFPDGDNLDSLRAMLSELNGISHRLDPSRLTATRKFTEGADLVDVVSPSIWPGWYSGNYKGFEKAITDARDKYPKLLHVEYGGDSHVGRHSENPVSGDAMTVPDGFEENIKPQKVKNVSLNSDWSENYIVDLFDWSLHISERLEWLTGNAQWAFKDFPTPLRPENP
ncbi:MAG: hypothetical protein NTV54_14265, partial [Ignavibacteriales bacterium]|nr:hypothetical protein [Ignavibacteriales bacterium]